MLHANPGAQVQNSKTATCFLAATCADNVPNTQEQQINAPGSAGAAGPANGGAHMTPATGTQGLTQSGLQNGNARRLTFQTGGGTTTLSRSPYARMIRPDLGAVPARPLGPLPPTLSGDLPPVSPSSISKDVHALGRCAVSCPASLWHVSV